MVLGTKVLDFPTFPELDLDSNPYLFEPKDVFFLLRGLFSRLRTL
jgi:hypothetical protein